MEIRVRLQYNTCHDRTLVLYGRSERQDGTVVGNSPRSDLQARLG
jgi:hypothetical protein